MKNGKRKELTNRGEETNQWEKLNKKYGGNNDRRENTSNRLHKEGSKQAKGQVKNGKRKELTKRGEEINQWEKLNKKDGGNNVRMNKTCNRLQKEGKQASEKKCEEWKEERINETRGGNKRMGEIK